MEKLRNICVVSAKNSREDRAMLRDILLHLAPTLRALTLCDPEIPDLCTPDFINLFADRCVTLERICCSEHVDFIGSIGPKLQVLEIRRNASHCMLDVVRDNCIRLRELYLGDFTRETKAFWKSLGKTLEKLSVEFYYHNIEEMEKFKSTAGN